MRYTFVLLLAGCSYAGHEKETGELRSRASQSAAWTPSPEGPASALESRLLRLLEAAPFPDLSREASFEDLVRCALARNPELRAQVKRLEAAIEQVPQAASPPDPELELELTLDDFVESFGKFMLGLMQPLLFPGKLEAAAKQALARAWAEWARLREMVLRIRADVAREGAEIHALDHALRIDRENLKLLGQLETVARTRFEAREASQWDVLRVQLRSLEAQNEIVRRTRERREAEIRLNALLGRRDLAAIGPIGLPEPAGEPAALPALASAALERRPEVAFWTHGLRAALEGLRLAELDFGPDFTPGVEYEVANGGRHSLMPKIAFPLPFVRLARRRAALAQARAMLGQAWHEYEAARVTVVREVAAAHARAVAARESLLLYRDKLRPQVKLTYEAALADYRAGRLDFLTVVDASIEQQRIQEEVFRLEADYFVAREDLRRALGGDE